MNDEEQLLKDKQEIAESYGIGEDQREASNEDIRFCNVDGGMWEGWLESTYSTNSDRARMEFDITTDFVNRFVGEWKKNRAGVYFAPDDDATSDDDADLLTGMYRADFNANDGRISVDTAVEELAECGIGHFKMRTEFDDGENPENDQQHVLWEPIYNSYSHVIWPADAKRVDKADARWCAVLTPYSEAAYKDAFPGEDQLDAIQVQDRRWLDWNTTSMSGIVVVAEIYRIVKKAVKVEVYQNLELAKVASYDADEAEKVKDELAADGWEFVRERQIERQTVEKAIFNGSGYIKPYKRIPGKYIPIIPVYGYRKFIDGKERCRGLVRKLKDANRVFNMNISRIAESAAASPDSTPILTRDQVKGLEDHWADHTGDPYKVINDLEDANGNPVHAGPVGYLNPTAIDANTAASTEIVSAFIQKVTGNAPQDTIDPDASGKAINAMRARENLNTQIVVDNITTAMEHSGRVYQSIISEIHKGTTSKGVMAEDGSENTVRINNDVLDQETGQLVKEKEIDGKRFKVSARVGPQYETERDATVDTLERLMKLVGEESKYFQPLLAMWMKNISGTGLEELKEFNRQEMLKMGLTQPETDEEKAMMQQLQQMTDPNDELVKAAAGQQRAETLNLVKAAENKEADTKKKQAETAKTISELPARMRYNPQTGGLDAAG